VGKRRLGRSGLDRTFPVPDNVWNSDCSSLIAPGGEEHPFGLLRRAEDTRIDATGASRGRPNRVGGSGHRAQRNPWERKRSGNRGSSTFPAGRPQRAARQGIPLANLTKAHAWRRGRTLESENAHPAEIRIRIFRANASRMRRRVNHSIRRRAERRPRDQCRYMRTVTVAAVPKLGVA
jgi:hypothetical protein